MFIFATVRVENVSYEARNSRILIVAHAFRRALCPGRITLLRFTWKSSNTATPFAGFVRNIVIPIANKNKVTWNRQAACMGRDEKFIQNISPKS
jgi:hypothetical protein